MELEGTEGFKLIETGRFNEKFKNMEQIEENGNLR